MPRKRSNAHDAADWRRVVELYSQVSDIVNDPEEENTLPDELVAALSEASSRVLAHYDGNELVFVDHLLEILSEKDNLTGSRGERFRHLYHDRRFNRFAPYHPTGGGRRRPKPFEAAVETCRRWPVLRWPPTGSKKGNGLTRALWDYRDTKPERKDNQRSFSGRDVTLPLRSKTVRNGYFSNVHVCHIDEHRFYPGLHQNLILPQRELRWESPRLRIYLRVLSFTWKIMERLRFERQLRPFEVQKISLSHTRSAHFSPHITRRADRFEL